MNRLKRTSALALTVTGCAGLVLGRLARPFLEQTQSVAPTVGWGAPFALFLGAFVLGALAWTTYAAIHRDRRFIHSTRGVRLLALAKASAVVGVLFAGAYAGYALAFVGQFETALGSQRVIRSGVAALGGVTVMIAALLLERACQAPGGDDENAVGRVEPSPG